MSSDVFDPRDCLPLSEVGACFPKRPSPATLWRWVLSGVKGPNGERIKLQSIRIAGRRYVRRSAVAEFIRAWNADADDVAEAPAVDHQRVNRALEKLGC
jgi:hypothetical protein